MRKNGFEPIDAVRADKVREENITQCCDIFRGIVKSTKLFLYAQIAIYLLLADSVFWVGLSAREFFQPMVSFLFPLAALVVTVIKRDVKGNLIGLGIDIASIPMFIYLRVMDIPEVLFILVSVIVHGVRAEKLYCMERIKDLYGYSRFNSFDICNQVLGDDSFADSIVFSYEGAFDNELMKYERSSHYIPPFFRRIQTAAMVAVLAAIGILAFVSTVAGRFDRAQSVSNISDRTSGAVKGKVTQIFDIKSYGTDSFTNDEYWVTFGGEQVCFSVPKAHKAEFEALMRYQHPESFDSDIKSSVKPSSKSVEFVGEIVKADTSKYADNRLTVSDKERERSQLPFNTKYYIKVYDGGFYSTLKTIGVILMIVGIIAWIGTLAVGAFENKRY